MAGSYPWLFAAQVASGASFAAWELATFLVFFDALRPAERTSVLSYFNLANSAAISLGSLVGARMLSGLHGEGRAYAALFATSLALRLLPLLLLRRLEPGGAGVRPLPTWTEAVRASLGSFEEPVLPAVERPAGRRRGD